MVTKRHTKIRQIEGSHYSLDCTTGLDYWTGLLINFSPVQESSPVVHELLDWTPGLDGLLDWTPGLQVKHPRS